MSNLANIEAACRDAERQVMDSILGNLKDRVAGRAERDLCDKVFSFYTANYVVPCIKLGFESRVVSFAKRELIPAVLKLEQDLGKEFHKGVLFYDTAIAHLLAGDEDGFEYYLAMTDEENVRVPGHPPPPRGGLPLCTDSLSEPTMAARVNLACDLLNGTVAAHPAQYSFVCGNAPVTADRFNAWRQNLDGLHQFELLRILHDIEVFSGRRYPDYLHCRDNPFILLRLAKALSHCAQWVESCLTGWQVNGPKILSQKLDADPDFGANLRNFAGKDAAGKNRYPGLSLSSGVDVNAELSALLLDLETAPGGEERHWRVLRILYLLRNATAHTIDPSLNFYQDRELLLKLLQIVFVSGILVAQLKHKPAL
jgi:hypothetical protein